MRPPLLLLFLLGLPFVPFVQAAERTLPLQLPESVPPAWIDEVFEAWAGQAPPGAESLRLYAWGPEGRRRPLESWLPRPAPHPEKDGPPPPPGAHPVDVPGAVSGALSGKAVYASACHGWLWYDSLGRYSTQRGNLFDTVEDFHNTEAMDQVLLRYLENAGAAVYTAKERDLNPLMALADDDGVGYTEIGSGFTDGDVGFADLGVWPYGVNPFQQGGTRRFPSNGGAVARWTPEIPADGPYAVYVSWDAGSDHSTRAHYRIAHPGGEIDRYFDQTVHGSTWQYVETLYLEEGESLVVELLGDAEESGRFLSADAVRVGGGMGDVSRHSTLTGQPRWEEAAVYHVQFNGAPTSVYDPYSSGDGSDPSSRSCWADWEHPRGEDAVYVSWHSNAGGGAGTDVFWYDGSSGTAYPGSRDLAELAQEELVSSARTLWTSSWGDRGARGYALSEINPSLNDEMPAILIEHGFHDNETDIAYIKHPRFRRDSARAIYRAIVRYFAERDGLAPLYLPEPPEDFAVTQDAEGLHVGWSAGPSGDPYGDAPLSYLVFRSTDGRSWDNGVTVEGTHLDLSLAGGETAFFRVSAVNAGGVSFPSEVLGARRSYDGRPRALIVSAFDRLETSTLVWASYGGSIGDVVRMILTRMNAFDTSVATGRALDAAGWSFDSVSNEVFLELDLDPYDLLVWVAGEESTGDESFSTAEQARVRAFVEAGGALWASGAEILWDLDTRGDASDRAFCEAVLGATLEADDAGTFEALGEGLLGGLVLDFGEAHGAPYPVEYPDAIASSHASLASYATGGVAAVAGGRVALFGFPFECIGDELVREEVARRLVPALLPGVEPDRPPEDTGDTGSGDDTSADSGPDPDTADTDADRPHRPPGAKVGLGERGCGCRATGRENSWGALVLLGFLGSFCFGGRRGVGAAGR